MNDRPLEINRFETLQLTSAVLAVINGFSIGKEGIFGPVFDAVLVIALTLLVSRGQRNWARWILLVIFVAGVVFLVVASLFGLTQEAFAETHLSTGNLILTGLVWMMQVAALALVFTPQSTGWLRSRHAEV